MRIIHKIEASLFINGLYGWGVGWLDSEFVSRWDVVCSKLAKEGPYRFRNSVMTLSDGFGGCAEFQSREFYAYMHPMEIAIEATSCKYTPQANEGNKFAEELKVDLLSVIENFIKPAFPEVNITGRFTIRDYEIDLDRPNLKTEEFF